MNMSVHEFRLIAAGWFLLILLLTIFWFAMLHRLSAVLKERLASTRSHRSIKGPMGVVLFLFRSEFKQTGDERMIAVCSRLRRLLYGYLGGVGAYIVFLVIMHTRY